MRPGPLRRLLRAVIEGTDGNIAATARLLGYTRPAIQYWLRKLGMRAVAPA